MAVIKPSPYRYHTDHILSEYRLNQLSVKMLKEEYFKLADRLLESRKYNKHLHSRIKGFKWMFVRRRKRRTKMYHLRILKASYIKKRIKAQFREKLAQARVTIRKREKKKVAVHVKSRVERSLARRLPRKVAKIKRHYQALEKKHVERSKKTIRRQISIRTRRKIFKATALAKENATIGLIRKTKLPGMGQYAGIYAMVIKEVASTLSMRFDDVCHMIWFGTFESFNVGGLTLMYPHLGSVAIRLKVNKFVRLGYLQCIGKVLGQKTYIFTNLGREFYDRIRRYMRRFRKPYKGKKITKKIFRSHFKTKKKIAKP